MPIKFECPACGKRLNAPDTAVGKTAKCPACSMSVTIPDAVEERIYEAEEVAESAPDEDWEAPPEPKIPRAKSSSAGRKSRSAFEEPEEPADGKPCPMCGEMINAAAKKCRFCGELLVEGGKKKTKRRASDEDSEMQVSDWLLCILCSGIGCIMGIVYLIQGKPKGGTMIGVSIGFVVLWNVFWGVIGVILENVN